ncbi:hypothetical protein CLV51_10543 [Chitinophaga niastensis]|uniref:DUF3375 family protein n=1 Tax=Chitinophaga niastensis TaxID=536980 RepID=A0A2P8HEQ9_CHINA|nr:hypothetical protein [Chitinophaga niastensis]PSL44671.1 hypothetical protein CLV51_10543 [Chitinophaga niastensis]
MRSKEIYDNYDLLLPRKERGGYLVIALYEKIESKELDYCFSLSDIEEVLHEIYLDRKHEFKSEPQWSKIRDVLFNYYVRNVPGEPWKYYLTDHAKGIVELMRAKLENPYKDHLLQKSFQEAFTLRHGEINSGEELERKFGRIFIMGPKGIVLQKIESLEDELRDAYEDLNHILDNDQATATKLVQEFARVFKTFGEKAEDINRAIFSKDKFLSDLKFKKDDFYSLMETTSPYDHALLVNRKSDWEKAQLILTDIADFFKEVDDKLRMIRQRIYHANDKLNELKETISARASYKIQLSKLQSFLLQFSQYSKEDDVLSIDLPVKYFYSQYRPLPDIKIHQLIKRPPDTIIEVSPNQAYEDEERKRIRQEVERQETINKWTRHFVDELVLGKQLKAEDVMNQVFQQEADLSVAYAVMSTLIGSVSENPNLLINVDYHLTEIKSDENIYLWRTILQRKNHMNS